MKKSVFLLLLTLPLLSSGQNNDLPNQKKVMLGVRFSPDLSNVIIDDAHFFSDYAPAFGFTTGLTVLYQPNRVIALESGVYYASKTFKTPKITVTDISGNPIGTLTENEYLNYLNIPLKFNFYLLQSKLKLFLSLGGSAGFPLSSASKSQINFDDGTTYHFNYDYFQIDKMNFSVIGGLGIDYALSPKFNLRTEPVYRRSLTSIRDTVDYYLYSFGLNVACLYSF